MIRSFPKNYFLFKLWLGIFTSSFYPCQIFVLFQFKWYILCGRACSIYHIRIVFRNSLSQWTSSFFGVADQVYHSVLFFPCIGSF